MPPPRPHPLARSLLVDRLNTLLETAWAKCWSPRPSLDPAALWRKAGAAFAPGDEAGGRPTDDVADFRLRLGVLCGALEEEARLNPLGRTIAHGQLVRVLRQRLALGRLWTTRPELPSVPLAPPLLVVGQMRSGTTRIHRLLAADPAHAATRFCDSWHPLPARPDLRPVWSGLSLFAARRLNPWLDAIHPFGAARVDEELGWLAAALDHCAYEAQWQVPSFTAWSEARDPAPVYREFARILRTDAAHRRNALRPRAMKVPQFAEDLATLLDEFPNARVIVARRDSEDVLASSVSLVANQMAIQSDDVDLSAIERECSRKIALRRERTARALAGFRGPLAECDFDALGRDWESEIARIYRALGLELGDAARRAMQREMRRAANGTHVAHRQQIERFADA